MFTVVTPSYLATSNGGPNIELRMLVCAPDYITAGCGMEITELAQIYFTLLTKTSQK